jgi:hypothetical protein
MINNASVSFKDFFKALFVKSALAVRAKWLPALTRIMLRYGRLKLALQKCLHAQQLLLVAIVYLTLRETVVVAAAGVGLDDKAGFPYVILNKTNLVISQIDDQGDVVVTIDADDKLIELRLQTNEDMDVCAFDHDSWSCHDDDDDDDVDYSKSSLLVSMTGNATAMAGLTPKERSRLKVMNSDARGLIFGRDKLDGKLRITRGQASVVFDTGKRSIT